jgi:hypothetical protein
MAWEGTLSGLNQPQPRLYRPAWLLRMFVRYEDFGVEDDSDAQDGAAPYKSPQVMGGVEQANIEAQIAQVGAGMAVGGGRSLSDMIQLQAQAKNVFRKVQKLGTGNMSSAGDNGAADKWAGEWITAPMELTIEDKGFREADTLEASFPFADLPLFPLVVRECRVEAYVGTVKAEDFATPGRWHLEPKMSRTCVLRFNGYVDQNEMESDGATSMVHFKARSYVATLMDGKINPNAKAYRVGAPIPTPVRPPDYGEGNVDLNHRPIIHNPDGSISTVFSMTFGPEKDGSWVLVPGVRFGLNRKMTDKEAYAWYKATGQYLGKFDSMQEADTYANTLHEDQAVLYGGSTPNKDEEPLTIYINRILSLYPPTAGGGKGGGDPFRAFWYASPTNKEPMIGSKMLMRSLQTAKSKNAAAGAVPGQEPPPIADPANEAADPAGQGGIAGTAAIPPKAITEDGMSVWDLITQACELCGVMPMYKPSLPPFLREDGQAIDPRNCLLVTPPEAFLDDIANATQIAGGARDGFQREFSNGSDGNFRSDVRFMIWGHNIEKMKLARHMGKVRPTAVEVRAYNPDAEGSLRQLSARFPLHNPKKAKGKGKSSNKSTEKGHGKIDVIRTFVIKGVRSKGMLERIAVSLYHQLTRAELSMSLETDELASYIDPAASMQAGSLVENHNDNPDILRLCAGTPVHVTVAKKSTDGADLTICALSEFYDLQANNIVELLTKQNDRWGWFRTDGQLSQSQIEAEAQKLQAVYRAAKLPTVYYCKGIRLQFKSDDQFFHASMELANYMPSNDPANMDASSQAMNDERKKRPTSPAAKKAAGEQQRTADVVARGTRQGAN